ncbi:MAG: regulatory signaling modulator protein AmpE [Pseudomonadota bacterium]
MTLFIVILALAAEHWWLTYQPLRRAPELRQWFNRIQQLPLPDSRGSGIVRWLLWLAPVLFVVDFLEGLSQGRWHHLLELGVGVVVLFFCLGPENLDRQVREILAAISQGHPDEARDMAKGMLGESPASGSPFSLQMADHILDAANHRFLAVIFWYALLGASGAVLYRMTYWAAAFSEDLPEEQVKLPKLILAWLDWLPARLTAMAYALGGSFDDALVAWHQGAPSHPPVPGHARDLLVCIGRGALRVDRWVENGEISEALDPDLLHAALTLVWRALIIWLVVMVIATLSYGFSAA